MLRNIVSLWVRFLLMVTGLNFWASFIWPALGPQRSLAYAVSTMIFSLLFAVIIETRKNYLNKKQASSHVN